MRPQHSRSSHRTIQDYTQDSYFQKLVRNYPHFLTSKSTSAIQCVTLCQQISLQSGLSICSPVHIHLDRSLNSLENVCSILNKLLMNVNVVNSYYNWYYLVDILKKIINMHNLEAVLKTQNFDSFCRQNTSLHDSLQSWNILLVHSDGYKLAIFLKYNWLIPEKYCFI